MPPLCRAFYNGTSIDEGATEVILEIVLKPGKSVNVIAETIP